MTTPNFNAPQYTLFYQNPAFTPSRCKSYHWTEKRQETRSPKASHSRHEENVAYAPADGVDGRKRQPQLVENL